MTATDSISEPPVQALCVAWKSGGRGRRAKCLEKRKLHSRDGIGVGHLQALVSKLGGGDAIGVPEVR